MKCHPYLSLLVGTIKKAVPVVASAFFLCLTHPAVAATNQVTGIAYGTDYSTLATAASITSISNGLGSLTIGYTGTTNISMNHNIDGSISLQNNFDQFTIYGGNTTISNDEFAVLFAVGGTNLHLNGGTFDGIARDVGYVGPPIPGRPPQTNTFSSAARGGIISQVENVTVNGTSFSGSALKESNGNVLGLDGLSLYDSSITFTTNGAANSTIQGGNAGAAAPASSIDASSTGGHGLFGIRSSMVISNGTFRGGNSGTATASGGKNASSIAGSAIFASATSTVVIVDGTFTGGSAGAASTLSQGGAGLELQDHSSAIIHGGTFTGGSGSPAIRLMDSDLTTYGGDFSAGGLYSENSGGTNHLDLLGGNFSRIELISATNALQLLTVSSNLSVSGFIIQNGGTVAIDNPSNNGLQHLGLYAGAMILSNDFTLGSGGKINFERGSLEISGVFSAQTGSEINLKIRTNQLDIITADIAYFQTNSTLSVDVSLAGFSAGTNQINVVSTTGGIKIINSGGFTNIATQINFEQNVNLETNVIGRTFLSDILLLGGNNLIYEFHTLFLADYWNADGQLADLADELDLIDNSTMLAIIDNLGPEVSKVAVDETYFTTLNTLQTALKGLNAAVGQSRSRGTEFREQSQLPRGAKGPEVGPNDWRPWIKYYGQFYTRSPTEENAGYNATLHGGVLGVDKSFGALLIGLSGGIGHYRIEAENNSREDMDAVQAAIYTTLGTEKSYLDAGIAYGYNQVESQTGGPFVLNSEFDTHLLSGYLGGGIGFDIPSIGTVITPEASAQYSVYTQEAYSETSTTATPRSFDEFSADSLRSSVGLNIAMLNTKSLKTFGFKIEGRFHWLHEFNPEPGKITFQLEGGNDYQITHPLLDKDLFRAGIGFSFFNTLKHRPKNVMLRLDFDELFGQDFNSHNLSAKAIYAF